MRSSASKTIAVAASVLVARWTTDAFLHTARRSLFRLPLSSVDARWKRVVVAVGSTTDADTAFTSSSSLMNDDETWWKSYELKDEALPAAVRKDFSILSTVVGDDEIPLVYLDSAATSQKPLAVTSALTNYYHTSNANVHRGAHSLSRRATSSYEAARDSIAKFVNAPSRNEIVFTSGATEALNLIAHSYGTTVLNPGDEVLISELEHHSNIVPWQILCQRTNATLRFVPYDPTNGAMNYRALHDLINRDTRIVSLQHVSNVLGCIHPIQDVIVPLIRSNGAPDVKIVLDACQSVPHQSIDVQELNVDFLVASGHKMCGPTGIGFLWGRLDLLNSMPPYKGGGEMIQEVTMDHSTYAPAPSRFEAGTPAIAQAIGFGAAIDYLTNVGMKRIEDYEHELGHYLHRRLDGVKGVTTFGPELGVKRGATVTFVCDNVHASDLSTFLDLEGIAIRAGHHCCQPLHRALGHSHSARASLYFYNTKQEVDYFIEKLQETLAFFDGMQYSNNNNNNNDSQSNV